MSSNKGVTAVTALCFRAEQLRTDGNLSGPLWRSCALTTPASPGLCLYNTAINKCPLKCQPAETQTPHPLWMKVEPEWRV